MRRRRKSREKIEVTVEWGKQETVTPMILRLARDLIYHGGDDSREDPPVPFPNTEVKLSHAQSTWLFAREDR